MTYFVSLIISGLGTDDEGTICAFSRSRPVRSLSSSGILIGYKKTINEVRLKRGNNN
jgi:hypothetical protein